MIEATVANYKLLRATSNEVLSRLVQADLLKGWELYGNPFGVEAGSTLYLLQAVIRSGDNSLQIRKLKLEGVRVLQSRLLTAAGGHNLSSTEILKVVLETEKELDDEKPNNNKL